MAIIIYIYIYIYIYIIIIIIIIIKKYIYFWTYRWSLGTLSVHFLVQVVQGQHRLNLTRP